MAKIGWYTIGTSTTRESRSRTWRLRIFFRDLSQAACVV